MQKVLVTLISIMFLLSTEAVQAQYSGDYDYSSERIWGITKATNSGLIGGFMFKYSKELKENLFHCGILEVVNIKHPQEQKYFANESGNMATTSSPSRNKAVISGPVSGLGRAGAGAPSSSTGTRGCPGPTWSRPSTSAAARSAAPPG